MRNLILLFLLLAVGPILAQSAIYKWVDQDGNLHFSDCPPEPAEECQVEEIVADPGPTLSEQKLRQFADRRAQLVQELRDSAAQRRTEQKITPEQRREDRAHEREFRSRQCTLARRNLEQLLQAAPVYREESRTRRDNIVRQGEDETLRDVETMQELLEQYCDD